MRTPALVNEMVMGMQWPMGQICCWHTCIPEASEHPRDIDDLW